MQLILISTSPSQTIANLRYHQVNARVRPDRYGQPVKTRLAPPPLTHTPFNLALSTFIACSDQPTLSPKLPDGYSPKFETLRAAMHRRQNLVPS
uniref:Uncharacterized protein n=1 Tax=Panagrellus redivivus TaxID=6233 RepID=A0A7E4W9S2_PANRE